jgi:hypothetical protein
MILHGGSFPERGRRSPESGWFTVVDVFRELGLEPLKRDTWSVGLRVMNLWLSDHGSLPVKDNRRKTNGGGLHCFALYPPQWRDRVQAIVASTAKARANQMDLFLS